MTKIKLDFTFSLINKKGF